MDDVRYCWLCKNCEHTRHCFSRETAEKIENGDTEGMTEFTYACTNYYPLLPSH